MGVCDDPSCPCAVVTIGCTDSNPAPNSQGDSVHLPARSRCPEGFKGSPTGSTTRIGRVRKELCAGGVGLGEVVSYEQERFVGEPCHGGGKAVPEVQCRRMSALPVATPSTHGRAG